MKYRLFAVLLLACLSASAIYSEETTEPDESLSVVSEQQLKDGLMQMLARFATYMKNDFQDCVAPNSVGEICGCFKGENTMANDERGVRPNADLSMICAFLVKYGKDNVTLPDAVTWDDLETMAMKSLVFAYSTHKANKLKVCSGNNYWGSTSTSDAVWESSLWAMSVAYSAFFQWDKLTEAQRGYIYQLLKAECNYELNRNIPTGYQGDTKAEENGWEADVLAATLGLFPNDPLAPRWFQRLREFAINSYSHRDDAQDATVIDPDYDTKTVKQLYKGQNLYDDFTLQNHNYFHTSYQNVVIQELGEAALALKLFQTGLHGTEQWKTNALMHNCDRVMKDVLNWLALSDGELAMPNGNDWSLFLYDQITSYSTNACFLGDADALMLEALAYRMIEARQKTTADGSWLLRPDVGARRMGVEAHRVMMTWLMHHMLSTADMTATTWEDFNRRYSVAKVFTSQNIVRASTDSRFTCFSWSTGLNSYTGYIAPHLSTLTSPPSPLTSNLIVPFRANNTGNFLGWYEVQGKNTNATPVVNGIYQLDGNAWAMNGELNCNDGALNHRFAIYSTPGNAVLYIDNVRANAPCTITAEKGGLMVVSVDDFTSTERTLYYPDYSADYDCYCFTQTTLNGSTFTTLPGPWVNVDNQLSIVNASGKSTAFGEKANNNSVMTAKLYGSYTKKNRAVKQDEVVDRRAMVYYTGMTAEATNELFTEVIQLTYTTPVGWNGVIVPDNDGGEYGVAPTRYMLLSNFTSDQPCHIQGFYNRDGKPVFSVPTTIEAAGSSATFIVAENHSIVNTLKFYIHGANVEAVQEKDNPMTIYVRNLTGSENKIKVSAFDGGKIIEKEITFNSSTSTVKLSIVGGDLLCEEGATFPVNEEASVTDGYFDVTTDYLTNTSFEEDETYGKADGNVTLGNTTYNPCYVNTVAAIDNKWPNLLPVNGWTPNNTLSGGSNFCRMYSMPYSQTQYCVSPSNVGNYTARCSRPIFDETCGDRVLTVLNSWDKGQNAITQTVTLPSGEYRLLIDARYDCPNQTTATQNRVTTSGNNTCTSLTGVKIGTKTDYRYPTETATWQKLCYDFTLDADQAVTVSLGYQSSASTGAANNTLLYLDNVRLLRRKPDTTTGINDSGNANQIENRKFVNRESYDLQGRKVSSTGHVPHIEITNGHKRIKQ